MVPVENLVGRATGDLLVDRWQRVYWKPWTWFTALRGEPHRQRLYRRREMSADVAAFVRDRLGHEARDIALFERALTHPSVGRDNYERLEFLGDRVLGLVIASGSTNATRTSPKASCRVATTPSSRASPAPRSAASSASARCPPRQAGARRRRQRKRQCHRRCRRGADRRALPRRRARAAAALHPRRLGAGLVDASARAPAASQVRAPGAGRRPRPQAARLRGRRALRPAPCADASPSASRSPGSARPTAKDRASRKPKPPRPRRCWPS